MASGTQPTHERLQMGLYNKTKTLLSKRGFFYFALLLFVVQAGWIAIHSAFPLAFDEGYHLGIIQLYAHQWSPFFNHLSPATGQFGALATDPSYLYHYLMSFPYRLFTLFDHNPVSAILFMRFINIGLFATGIVIFRKVLLQTGASKALVNLVILAFTLLPLESFTAAQINYDNLVFPLTAIALLLALQFNKQLRADDRFDTKRLLLLASVCLLGSQVKYAFLPIFLGVFLFESFVIFRWWRQAHQQAWQKIRRDLGTIPNRTKLLVIGLLLVSAGLFGWRYGYNYVRYQALIPNCSKVMSVHDCEAYGAWNESYQLGLHHVPAPSLHQFIAFDKAWVHIMGDELFTVLNVNAGGSMVNPVRQFVTGSLIIAAAGVIFVIAYWRRLMRMGYPIGLFVVVSLTYIGTLFLQNYSDYTRYGIPIAIQGRYLLPILLLLLLIGAQGYAFALRETPRWKGVMAVCLLLVGLQGGGVMTYELRSNASWYWSHAAETRLKTPPLLTSALVKTTPRS